MSSRKPSFGTARYKIYKTDGKSITTDKFVSYKYPIIGVVDYGNHRHLYCRLNPCAQYLLDYLTRVMDKDTNQLYKGQPLRLEFALFMKSHCGILYEDRTIRVAYNQLEKAGYIIRWNKFKRDIINPRYYFKGTPRSRHQLFNTLLKDASKPPQDEMDLVVKLGMKYI